MRFPLVPLFLLIATSISAQPFGHEFPVTPPGPLLPVRADLPRVASNGKGFAAVWRDYRANGDVYAARFDVHGTNLDPAGIHIAEGQGWPAIASAGGDYLIADADPCSSVSVLRFSADGSVGTPHVIATTNGLCTSVELASNGDTYLAVWMLGNGALLDRDGNIIAGPFTIGKFIRTIGVASDGHDYMVIGANNAIGFPVEVVPISAAGAVGNPRVLFSAHPPDVAIASNGSRYLAVAIQDNTVHAQLLHPDGTADGAAIDQTVVPGQLYLPRTVWTGSSYAVDFIQSTLNGSSFHITTIDPLSRSAKEVSRIEGPVSGWAWHDVVGSNGVLLIAWSLDGFAVNSAFVPVTGLSVASDLKPTPLSVAPASQWMPKLVSNGSSSIVMWRESNLSLRGIVVDGEGQLVGEPVIVAQLPGDAAYQSTFVGSTFLVTWKSGANLYGRRFTSALQPLDSDPVLLAEKVDAEWQPYAIAAGDNDALLAWASPDVYATLVHVNSQAMMATPIAVPPLPLNDHAVSAAWNGTEFLLVWGHARGPEPTQGLFPEPPDDIDILRVARDGHLIDPSPRTIASAASSVGTTTAASNGNDFYAAWDMYASGGAYTPGSAVVQGKAIAADGTSPSFTTSLSGSSPSVMRYKSGYLLSWLPVTSSFYASIPQFTIVDANGVTSAVAQLPEMERPYLNGEGPLFAIGPAGILVAYERFANEPQFAGVSRVFARSVSPAVPRRRAASF